MKKVCLPVEKRGCPHCGAKNSLGYYRECLRGDFYNCNKCFGLVSWDDFTVQKEVGEAYPDRADKRFYPKIGEEFYYFKWCGQVRGDIWSGHRFQERLVRRGMAPFRNVAEAEAAFEKKEWDDTIA